MKLVLRRTKISDLDIFFEFQQDKDACFLAAFMPENVQDKSAFLSKHKRFLSDPTINNQTILVNGRIVGSIAKFIMEGEPEITYWIDKPFWGQGIATKALQKFLTLEPVRPIRGRVAFDNYGSRKVLENCGFIKVGSDKGFASARQAEIEEYIYKLS